MKKGLLASVFVPLVISGFVLAGSSQEQRIFLPEGSVAPTFSGKAHDGRDISLDKMLKKGPIFVLFWKEVCPHNPRASILYNTLYEAYKDKVQFVGIVWTSPEKIAEWAKGFQVQYPLLPDPEKKLIKAYEMRFSIVAMEIGKDGRIAQVFPGYGKETLENLNRAFAKAAEVEVANVDLSKAPPRQTFG